MVNIKGKLVKWASDILLNLPWGEIASDTAERIADRMIENGVTVQRRGRWENGFCTYCKTEAITEWNEVGGEHCLSKYCPACGAKMGYGRRMFECEWCGDPDCCERLDLRSEPVLCDECYLTAKELEEERDDKK